MITDQFSTNICSIVPESSIAELEVELKSGAEQEGGLGVEAPPLLWLQIDKKHDSY